MMGCRSVFIDLSGSATGCAAETLWLTGPQARDRLSTRLLRAMRKRLGVSARHWIAPTGRVSLRILPDTGRVGPLALFRQSTFCREAGAEAIIAQTLTARHGPHDQKRFHSRDNRFG
jgi:hypothetical protein